jgi:hypothetical protein
MRYVNFCWKIEKDLENGSPENDFHKSHRGIDPLSRTCLSIRGLSSTFFSKRIPDTHTQPWSDPVYHDRKTRSLFSSPLSSCSKDRLVLSPQSVRVTQTQYRISNLCHEPQDTHERPCVCKNPVRWIINHPSRSDNFGPGHYGNHFRETCRKLEDNWRRLHPSCLSWHSPHIKLGLWLHCLRYNKHLYILWWEHNARVAYIVDPDGAQSTLPGSCLWMVVVVTSQTEKKNTRKNLELILSGLHFFNFYYVMVPILKMSFTLLSVNYPSSSMHFAHE